MQRTATIAALPTSFNIQTANTLYNLLLAITGMVPVDGIFPDRCCGLKIVVGGTGPGTLYDRNGANVQGINATTGNVLLDRVSDRNTICLRDFYPVGPATTSVTVEMDFK